MSDKITASHLERRAVVYLRQSTLRQVSQHGESTARQYALRERALALGWRSDQVMVIDEDLGVSGTSVEGRGGFQRLADDVAHGRIGVTGIGCWTCAALRTSCSRTTRRCMRRATTTTSSCWG